MTLLTALVASFAPGLIIAAVAGAVSRDVKAAAGGGIIGTILGVLIYWSIRLSYWLN